MSEKSKGWSAWINVMPPGPPTLHVTGTIDVGNESDSATLVFDSWQKKIPPNLILRIVPRTIFVPRDPGEKVVRLHYSQQLMPGHIGSIIVVYPDDSYVTIEDIPLVF